MTNEEIIERLKPLARRHTPGVEAHAAIESVAVKDKVAYVTDGRVAMAVPLEGDVADSVPENYPMGGIQEYVGKVDEVKRWYRMGPESAKALFQVVLDKTKASHIEAEASNRERYTHARCPCCHALVYWDTWNDELVEDVEENLPDEPRDIWVPIWLQMGDKSVLVNFGYVYMILKAMLDDLDDVKDVMVAGASSIDGRSLDVLLLRHGPYKAVLCGLRGDDAISDTMKCTEVSE